MLALFSFFKFHASFGGLVKSNICITNIYWTKFNFPSKVDFKSDEDKKKHSIPHREVIVKFRHTLLVIYM